MNPIAKTDVLGIPVSIRPAGKFSGLMSKRNSGAAFTITFVNPYSCALANRHAEYPALLARFDIVSCDGIGMVAAAKLRGLGAVTRESFDFTSMAGPVFQWALEQGLLVGLVGGEAGVAQRAARVLAQAYPGLLLSGCFSGFGDDIGDALEYYHGQETGLVICGMGAPLQEKFLLELIDGGWNGIGMTCGGFLDQLSQGSVYYPVWIDRLNIRFLYRLYREPRRLWRRYLIDYQVFMVGFARLMVSALTSRLFKARN